MKHAKVSELKAKLSEYLAGVRAGGTVIVYDRVTPIAKLVPIDDAGVDELQIEEATVAISELRKLKPIRLQRRIDVDRLLRESRGTR